MFDSFRVCKQGVDKRFLACPKMYTASWQKIDRKMSIP